MARIQLLHGGDLAQAAIAELRDIARRAQRACPRVIVGAAHVLEHMTSRGKHQRDQAHRRTRLGKPANSLQSSARTIRQTRHRQVVAAGAGKRSTQCAVGIKRITGPRIAAPRRTADAVAHKEGHGPRLRQPCPHKRCGKTIHVRGMGQEWGADDGLQPQTLSRSMHALAQVGLSPSVNNHTGHNDNPARASRGDLFQYAFQLGCSLTAASQKPANRRATKSQLARHINGIGHCAIRRLDRFRTRLGTRGAVDGKHRGIRASAGARSHYSVVHA